MGGGEGLKAAKNLSFFLTAPLTSVINAFTQQGSVILEV